MVWPDDRFDVAWVLERGTDAEAFRFRQVLQRVLAGDSDQPIAMASESGPG